MKCARSATIDLSAAYLLLAMTVPEESVLQPRLRSFEHSDDWPNFSLSRFNVTSQQTGQQVSLLSANKAHPVRVTGRVDSVDDEWKHLIRDKRLRERTIALNDITTYAFAEYNDGTHGFWAAGQAGWFEVQNVLSTYEKIYASMDEAASIFYMLADKLRRAVKKRPKFTPKALDKYATQIFNDVCQIIKNLLHGWLKKVPLVPCSEEGFCSFCRYRRCTRSIQ